MPRYEVIPSKRYRNIKNDRKASIYGACPWTSAAEKADWVLETVGWTVRDNNTNTIGFGRVPFKAKEEAQAFADSLSSPQRPWVVGEDGLGPEVSKTEAQ